MDYFEYDENEIEYLKKDLFLKKYIDRMVFIKREVFANPFESIVNVIISQQISNKALETIWNKVKALFPIIRPKNILDSNIDILRGCGVSPRKAKYIKNIAEMIENNQLNLDNISKLDDEKAIKILIQLPGIGIWTAKMILIFGFKRKNIISFDDLVIIRALKFIYQKEEISEDFFNFLVSKYSPYCTIASFYLWEIGNKLK